MKRLNLRRVGYPFAWAVPALSRVRPGRWLLRKLGWQRYVRDRFTKPHRPDCPGGGADFLPRPNGSIRVCSGCGGMVEIRFSYWEPEDGTVPPEVVHWLAEDLLKYEASRVMAAPCS